MSDRIAVFNEGRVEQIGPPTEIYERPGQRLRRRLRRRLEPARARWPALHGAPGEDLVHRERQGAQGTSCRGGDDQRRLLRRDDHAVSRRPRSGGTAPNRPPEPGDDLRGGPGRTRPQSENWMASGSDRRRRGRGGRKVSRLRARSAWLPAAIVGGLAATMLVIAGCGGSSSSDNGSAQKSVGAGEGQLNLVAWPGYVADPWKSDFEKQTGCQINLKEAGTSDEMVDLMRTGQWDGVSASGNATAKLVDGGDVAPVNTDLVPNYKTIFDDLKNQPYNTFDGTPLRDPPRARGEPLDVELERRQAKSDLVVGDARSESGREVQGQDQRVRRSDLHRGCRRVPEGPSARPGDHRSRTSSTTSSSMRPSTCSSSSIRTSVSTGRTPRSRSTRSPTGTSWSARRGSTSTSRCWPTSSRCRPRGQHRLPADRGCDGLVGHLDDREERGSSELHVQVDEFHRLARGQCRGRSVLR